MDSRGLAPGAVRLHLAEAVGELTGFARRLDPGLTDQDFADAGRRLDQVEDGWFASLGFSGQDVAALRERFAAWPRISDRPL